jgi:hypothetical protein
MLFCLRRSTMVRLARIESSGPASSKRVVGWLGGHERNGNCISAWDLDIQIRPTPTRKHERKHARLSTFLPEHPF